MKKRFIASILCAAFFAAGPGAGVAEAQSEPSWFDNITVEFGLTGIFQGTAGNTRTEANGLERNDQYDYSYSVDAALIGEIAEGHTLNVVFEAGEGEAAADNFSARATPNYDAADTTGDAGVIATVAQAYYEGEFADGALSLALGKMDVHAYSDGNEYASDETEQFLNGLFVRSIGVIFAEHEKYYVPTVAVTFQPYEFVSLIYTYSHNSGDDFFSDGYHWAELGLHPKFGELQGNYRFAYAKHDIDHTDIDDGSAKKNSGMFNVSADQALTENVGLFFRYAQQDENLAENEVKSAISGGISIGGGIWGRGGDTLGVAYGKITLNDKVVTENNEGESVMEVYYKCQVNDNLAVSADVQVFNDIERAEKRNVTVFGLRLQAGF